MLDFKDQLQKTIISYYFKYIINPFSVKEGQDITFDCTNQIHYTNSLLAAGNKNSAVSNALTTPAQYDKALEIIKVWQNNKKPFAWVVVSNSLEQKERAFFEKQGFVHAEQIVAMVLNLDKFHQEMSLNENEKIKEVRSLDDVAKFRDVIKSAFPPRMSNLRKYYNLYELAKQQKVNYQVYLTIDDQPTSTGQFYFIDDLVVIDDIATSPDFQKRGLTKKVMHHLLNTSKNMGYHQAALIATPVAVGIYEKLGFQQINMYFDIYQLN